MRSERPSRWVKRIVFLVNGARQLQPRAPPVGRFGYVLKMMGLRLGVELLLLSEEPVNGGSVGRGRKHTTLPGIPCAVQRFGAQPKDAIARLVRRVRRSRSCCSEWKEHS